MSRVFAITAATDTVRIDKQRQGEATFTVTNTSGQPLRGRANVVATAPAHAEWFTIVGADERDFGVEATDQMQVKISLPADVPEGNYHFQIDFISVDNPDEDYAEGPSISFAVAPPPPPPKPFPWWIIIVIVSVIVGGIVLWKVLDKPEPVQPDEPPVVTDTTGHECKNNNECGNGQTCTVISEETSICLRDVNQACTNERQCSSLLCRSGQCTTLANGQACTSSAQCQSKFCTDGKCAKRLGVFGTAIPYKEIDVRILRRAVVPVQ